MRAAAVPHDYLFQTGKYGWAFSNRAMLHLMREDAVDMGSGLFIEVADWEMVDVVGVWGYQMIELPCLMIPIYIQFVSNLY